MRAPLAIVTAIFVLFTSQAPSRAADLRFPEDAALRAVHFVDGREGWAVGDEGTIWHTIDAGQTTPSTQPQVTGVDFGIATITASAA